ncbi:MAG TPA: mannonate dehydratase, partial [Segetibacter sp.]
YDIGFKGTIRPDHVPTMAGEDNNRPGYMNLGPLFAIGYMRGLLETIKKKANKVSNTLSVTTITICRTTAGIF